MREQELFCNVCTQCKKTSSRQGWHGALGRMNGSKRETTKCVQSSGNMFGQRKSKKKTCKQNETTKQARSKMTTQGQKWLNKMVARNCQKNNKQPSESTKGKQNTKAQLFQASKTSTQNAERQKNRDRRASCTGKTCKYAKRCKFGQFAKKKQTSSARKDCKK